MDIHVRGLVVAAVGIACGLFTLSLSHRRDWHKWYAAFLLVVNAILFGAHARDVLAADPPRVEASPKLHPKPAIPVIMDGTLERVSSKIYPSGLVLVTTNGAGTAKVMLRGPGLDAATFVSAWDHKAVEVHGSIGHYPVPGIGESPCIDVSTIVKKGSNVSYQRSSP